MWNSCPPSLPPAPGAPEQPSQSFRPAGQQAELEALRQRGLARLLNRHFTAATQRIAQEKAAADAALRDLEGRKQTSPSRTTSSTSLHSHNDKNSLPTTTSNVPTTSHHLSQWEELYMKAHKWRSECRRKERETLLLYQRYVDKFGGTGHVQVPAVQGDVAAATTTTTSSPQSLASPVAASPGSSHVPAAVQRWEDSVAKHSQTSNQIAVPSLNTLGAYTSFASLNAKGETEFRNFYRQQFESGNVTTAAPQPHNIKEAATTTTRTAATEEAPESSSLSKPTTTSRDVDETASRTSKSGKAAKEEVKLVDEDFLDEDDDMLSLVSGLTSLNSATTRQILHDCEFTVQTFLEQEGKAVQAILSVAGGKSTSSRSSAALGSLQSQAATEAENMVKQMKDILYDFEEKHPPASTDAHRARPYPCTNPDEKWMVYYDETFQREYYHEAKTNRTQWEAPEAVDATSASSAGYSSSALAHVDVMPEVQHGRSLIAQYRQVRRRRRKKRRNMLLVAAAVTAAAGGYLYYAKPEVVETAMGAIVTYTQPVQAVVSEWIEDLQWQSSRGIAHVERSHEEVERQQQKSAEEAARRRAEQSRRQRQAQLLEEAAAEAARLDSLRRPVGCNIPLAYLVHRRCFRLASENPVYDAFSLTQAMMQ